jgi:hypothetical protein
MNCPGTSGDTQSNSGNIVAKHNKMKDSRDPLDRMTFKRIYFLLALICIIGAFGLGFGNGDINIYMGSSVGVLSGVSFHLVISLSLTTNSHMCSLAKFLD